MSAPGASSKSCALHREFPRSLQLAENKKAPKLALGAKGDGVMGGKA